MEMRRLGLGSIDLFHDIKQALANFDHPVLLYVSKHELPLLSPVKQNEQNFSNLSVGSYLQHTVTMI